VVEVVEVLEVVEVVVDVVVVVVVVVDVVEPYLQLVEVDEHLRRRGEHHEQKSDSEDDSF